MAIFHKLQTGLDVNVRFSGWQLKPWAYHVIKCSLRFYALHSVVNCCLVARRVHCVAGWATSSTLAKALSSTFSACSCITAGWPIHRTTQSWQLSASARTTNLSRKSLKTKAATTKARPLKVRARVCHCCYLDQNHICIFVILCSYPGNVLSCCCWLQHSWLKTSWTEAATNWRTTVWVSCRRIFTMESCASSSETTTSQPSSNTK